MRKNKYRKITMTQIQIIRVNHITLHAGKQVARSAEVGALATVIEKVSYRAKIKFF